MIGGATRRESILVGPLVFLLASMAGTHGVDAAPARVYLADLRGEAWVSAPGSPALQQAALGQSLAEADRLSVGVDAGAVLLSVDGRFLRLEAGSEAIVGDALAGSLGLALPAELVATVAAGLGHWGEWSAVPGAPQPDQAPGSFAILSPRNELIVEYRPWFFWSGGRKRVRLRVRGGEKQTYQSWMAPEGSMLRYPVWAIPLEPGGIYEWWMNEIRARTPATITATFHVASDEQIRRARGLELALATAERALESPSAANFARCAYYGEIGAWSRLLLAAEHLPDDGIRPAIVRKARQVARDRLDLDRDAAIYLLALMVWMEHED